MARFPSLAAVNILVFSHLRWDFVFQRPQHLMTRFAKNSEVVFWEEPVIGGRSARLKVSRPCSGVTVLVPYLPHKLSMDELSSAQDALLLDFLRDEQINSYLLWYYNPMAIGFTRRLKPKAVVYDCMDELSAFRGAPLGLRKAEAELVERCNLLFTGGQSLFEAKKDKHPSVHCFPSSIDREFFETARHIRAEREDQAAIPRPRLGYVGVIDERMDMDLVRAVATARPDWHFVMVGPVIKIAEFEVATAPNIHYLGSKQYADLPAYMAGWDIGLLPFARNDATRFISPTKTPEYLAAGLPVISTSIADVVRPYGDEKLVVIADTAEQFIQSAQSAMSEDRDRRLTRVDAFLQRISWDLTWARMARLIDIELKRATNPTRPLVLNGSQERRSSAIAD